MATHSRILACGIPWTEEPDGLESMGSQRVRHKLVTEDTYTQMFVIAFLPRSKHLLILWVVTVYSNLGAQENSLSLFPIFPLIFAMK